MEPVIYFTVVVDADPKQTGLDANDDYLMTKYDTTIGLLKRHIDGKGAVCVHTSPQYRERFFQSPFIEFWERWTHEGGELILHPEEDPYPTPETASRNEPCYNDIVHMESIIKDRASYMKGKKLPFAAFRGGFFGLTDDIVKVLKKVGIKVDLSCAPGIVCPERAADWSNAPASGYYLSEESYRQSDDKPGRDAIFEIPLGWDGQGIDINRNYLFHERSTYKRMCNVWEMILARSRKNNCPQFVNFLCHTYSMRNTRLRTRCESILSYMRDHNGIPVTTTEAKRIYDELSLSY